MTDITSYTISVPSTAIDDLKQRLSLARFPDELDDAGWDMGVPLSDVKRLTQYWKDSYDWRATEKELNKLPQFVTPIQCDGFEPLVIHFVHQPSKVKNAIPLLFIHGWPGSFMEVTKILGPLGEGDGVNTPAFHIVAPSLPNFGFSEGTKKRGFALAQYAETMNKLMLKLGYNEYVTQGGKSCPQPSASLGDWGSHISRTMALLHPRHCRATHLNLDNVDEPPSLLRNPLLAVQHALTPYKARERAALARTAWFRREGEGYSAEQKTRPQTLGYALADSPGGLLAWIYEKLHDWTDAYPWTPDEVCAWAAVYWFSTAGPAASLRIYYEAHHHDDGTGSNDHQRNRRWSPGVRLGFSRFPKDLELVPDIWARTLGPTVFQRVHESGGHFAAYERPNKLVEDVNEMFGRGGGAFGVVEGRSGYT